MVVKMALAVIRTSSGESSGLGPDWQLGCSELKQRGGHLLQTGQWADCSFLVGTEPHQITVKAHKLILASASPVFEAMFFGGMAEGDGPIKILDVQPDAFKTLLLHIYTDSTIIRSFDKACSVFYAAKKYMLPYLVKECAWFIAVNLEPPNVCRAYELALLFDENLLVDKCLKLMETETKQIVSDDSFYEADLKTVNTLLSLDCLHIENELDLFCAVERYAKVHLKSGQFKRRREVDLARCACECSMKKMKLSGSQDESLNATMEMNSVMSESLANTSKSEDMERHEETGELMMRELRTPYDSKTSLCMEKDVSASQDDVSRMLLSSLNNSMCSQEDSGNMDQESIRCAVEKIRFLTLTATQFAAGPARSPLLSESEAFAVLMNILSRNADVAMPVGFSTSRQPRNQQNLDPEMCEDKSEAVFRFTVLNFKTRRRSVESRPFLLLAAPWTLRLVPRVDSDTSGQENKHFGLYLKYVGKKDEAFQCRVRADIRLLAQPPASHVRGQIHKTFTNTEPEWGIARFVGWDAVLASERGLLAGNAITLEAHLVAQAV